MPIFTTPEPISVAIDLVVGDVRITAGDRADTVGVGPSDGSHEPDVRAAEQTRRIRGRQTARQGAEATRSWPVRQGRIDRRDHRAAGRLARAGRVLGGGVQLRGSARRVSGQDVVRGHPARPHRQARGEHRRRRDRRRPRGGSCRGQHRVRQGARAPDRRHRCDQELQRRHLGRRDHRRRTTERSQRGHLGRPRSRRHHRQRRRPNRRDHARLGRAQNRLRRDRDRHSSRHRRPTRCAHVVRQGAHRTWTPRMAPSPATRRSKCAPTPATGTSRSAIHRTRKELIAWSRRDSHNPRPAGDFGHRTPEGLRRQCRPRRDRPHRGRRDDLLAARPQRRRQDHDGADPVHP